MKERIRLTQEQRLEHFKRLGMQPVPYGEPSEPFLEIDRSGNLSIGRFNENDEMEDIFFDGIGRTRSYVTEEWGERDEETGKRGPSYIVYLDTYKVTKHFHPIKDDVLEFFPNKTHYARFRERITYDEFDTYDEEKILQKMRNKELMLVTWEEYSDMMDREPEMSWELGYKSASFDFVYRSEDWVMLEMGESLINKLLKKKRKEVIAEIGEWWKGYWL